MGLEALGNEVTAVNAGFFMSLTVSLVHKKGYSEVTSILNINIQLNQVTPVKPEFFLKLINLIQYIMGTFLWDSLLMFGVIYTQIINL